MKNAEWWTISDSVLSNLILARRPVVGYLNRSMMASNTSIINAELLASEPFYSGISLFDMNQTMHRKPC